MTVSNAAQHISENVLEEYRDKITDNRLEEVMTSLISHLHQFAMDVELRESEWACAIDYLTRTGQICDEKRQEFILLSDVLGLSMVVDAINYDKGGVGTENTVLGPFHVGGAPVVEYGGSLIRTEQPQGEVVLVRGSVVDPQGQPIAGASLDIWLTAGNARYFVQDPDTPEYNMYGVASSQANGRYCFVSEMPVCYPIPVDGPVGELLAASNRHNMRPAHMHFIVEAAGYQRLQTHLFDSSDPHLEADAVFATKQSLVVNFAHSEDAGLAQEFGLPTEFRTLDFDFVLLPE